MCVVLRRVVDLSAIRQVVFRHLAVGLHRPSLYELSIPFGRIAVVVDGARHQCRPALRQVTARFRFASRSRRVLRLRRGLCDLFGHYGHVLIDFFANGVRIGHGLQCNSLRVCRSLVRSVRRSDGLSGRGIRIIGRRLRGIGRRDSLLSRLVRRIGRCHGLSRVISRFGRRSDGISRVALSLFDATIKRIDGRG